jgi:hypothetical protein
MQEETQMICIIAFAANHLFAWRGRSEQGGRVLDIGDESAGQQEGVRTALLIDKRVDFRRAAAARTADDLALCPSFLAPLAERCTLTAELSIMVSAGGSQHSISAGNIRCYRHWLQRLYRLKTGVYGPYSSGSARHRQASRNRWMIPLMTRRSSWHCGPVWTSGRCGAIAAHYSSLSQNLYATNQALLTSLNHDAAASSIGYKL